MLFFTKKTITTLSYFDEKIIKDYSEKNDYYFSNWENKRTIQKYHTKRDCFILMGCDEEKYHEFPQLEAGFFIVKKTQENIKLIKNY